MKQPRTQGLCSWEARKWSCLSHVNTSCCKVWTLVKSCSKIAHKGKSCLKLLGPKKGAPNAKSCSKVAEHNRDMPILRWNRKQKNRFGPGYLGPRFLNFGTWRFLGTLSFLGPAMKHWNREQKKYQLGPAWWASFFKSWGPCVFWGTWAL
jgi:hypothetical protein